MKIYGKWLIVQQLSNGARNITSSGKTRKSCEELLDIYLKRIESNLWSDGKTVFWVEKNMK